MGAKELREALLSRATVHIREVGELEGFGKLYVRVATIAERKELLRLGRVSKDGSMEAEDGDRFIALCITRLACDETGVRIWGDGDAPAVMGLGCDDAYWAMMGKAAGAALGAKQATSVLTQVAELLDVEEGALRRDAQLAARAIEALLEAEKPDTSPEAKAAIEAARKEREALKGN